MSRAYLIYIVMFAVLIGGLSLILTIGKSVRPPDDLAGEWTVTWNGAPPPMANNRTMRIEQSGRFFVVRFGQGSGMSLVLQSGWNGAADGRTLEMSLSGTPWKMNLRGNIPLGETRHIPQMRITLEGPSRHTGEARRAGAATSRATGIARAR